MPDVLTSRRGDTAWLRLDRPERRNAYDANDGASVVEGIRASRTPASS